MGYFFGFQPIECQNLWLSKFWQGKFWNQTNPTLYPSFLTGIGTIVKEGAEKRKEIEEAAHA